MKIAEILKHYEKKHEIRIDIVKNLKNEKCKINELKKLIKDRWGIK